MLHLKAAYNACSLWKNLLVFYRNNFPSEHNTHFIMQHCSQYWVQYISDRGDLVTILESFVTYIYNFRQPLVTSSLVIHGWVTVNVVILYLSTFKFDTNSDFLIPISLQPNVVDLRYFKLWIMLHQIILV